MVYKNISSATKIYYGVTFKPGDVKTVPGYVNDRHMIPSALPVDKTSVKVVKSTTKKADPDNDVKAEETQLTNKEDKPNG